jgi:hypothetical protein
MTEKDFDKLLSVAMVHVAEEDASSLLKTKDELKAAGIPEHKFSPEFERRIATIKRSITRYIGGSGKERTS